MIPSDQSVLLWRTSSYSDATGGECVEVAAAKDGVMVRDSKDPDGPVLALTTVAISDLLNRVRGQ